MTRFVRADSLTQQEIDAGIDDGSLRYTALGPADGKWLVKAEPDDDPNEIHSGLPGGDLMFAKEFRYADEGDSDDE